MTKHIRCQPHRKRVVGEVTRGVTARDEYEKVARDIRFGFYKEVGGWVWVCLVYR